MARQGLEPKLLALESGALTTANSRLADTSLLRTLAITYKIKIPTYRGLTENDYGTVRTLAIPDTKRRPEGVRYTRVDCIRPPNIADKIYTKTLSLEVLNPSVSFERYIKVKRVRSH